MIHEIAGLLKRTGGGIRFLLLLILRAPFDSAWTVIHALFLQRAFDSVAQNNTAGLTDACLWFGIASACLFLYNGTIWRTYAPFVTRMEGKLRTQLCRQIASFSYERIKAVSSAEWMTRLNMDVEMPFSRPLHLPHAACAVMNISVSAAILWRIDPAVLGWVMLFAAPPVIINQLWIARAMPKLNQKALEAAAENTADLTALITCADMAAMYDAQDHLMERFEKSSLDLMRAQMKMRLKQALSAGILPIFGLGGYVVLLVVSAGRIADGNLTFGGLTAAFQYRGGILKGVMMLINSLISIQASMAGIRRLNDTMSEKTEEANG